MESPWFISVDVWLICHSEEGREIRIGLHIGSVMRLGAGLGHLPLLGSRSGIVGKLKPQYGLFGTAMNTAA